MSRVVRWTTFVIVLASWLLGCADGTSHTVTTTTSLTSSTTSSVMSEVYNPYAGTNPAVEPLGTVTKSSLSTPDGRVRTYRLYVPRSVGAQDRVPLLVALHGGLGWGEQFAANSGFDGLAESNRFIVVYPDGTNARDGSTRLLTWNGGICCGPAVERNVDDVTFIRLMIDEIIRTNPVDDDRVFATGHSNGAFLAYRLACELSDRISAIGVQAGALGVPCSPTRPVSVFHLHGVADTNIPIDGGRGTGVSGLEFPSPREAPVTFAAKNECGSGPVEQRDPSNPDVVAKVWSSCSQSRTVMFVTVAGASHAWMGHAGSSAGSTTLVGEPYEGFDASRAIWSFLAAQPVRPKG